MPALLNFNFFNYRHLAPMMQQVLDSGKAVLGFLQRSQEGSDTGALINTFLTLDQYRHDNITYVAKDDPMTHVAYPVFDSLVPTTRNVTGLIITTILWHLLLENVLAANIHGVIVVLRNSLNESSTYRIDGKTASFIAPEDVHDPTYDDMEVTTDISTILAERANPKRWSYTSVALDDGYTSYSIHIYPSSDMEGEYVTKKPIIFSVVVGMIFVFTSLVFLLYGTSNIFELLFHLDLL